MPIMKLIKIFSAISFTMLFSSCIGSGYHRLIIQDESSNIYLTKDSSAYFNNEDFDLIFNESVTNINFISQQKGFSYVFIDTKIGQVYLITISYNGPKDLDFFHAYVHPVEAKRVFAV